jgi:hypothetical protein
MDAGRTQEITDSFLGFFLFPNVRLKISRGV